MKVRAKLFPSLRFHLIAISWCADEDVTEPPRRPRPSECCGMRCPNCVWIQYEEKLKKYRKHRMKMLLEMRTRSSNMGDHLRTTSENEPVPLPRRVDSVQLNGSKRVYYGLSGFPGGNSEQNSNLKSQSSENKSKRVYYGLQGFPKEQTDPIQGNGRKRVYLGLSGFQNGNHEQKLHDKNDSPGVNPEQLLDKSQKLTNTLSSEHADTRSWINGKAQHYFSKAVDYNLEGSKRVSFKLKGF